VAEAKPAGRPRHLAENTLGHGLVEDVERLVGREPTEPYKSLEIELPSQDGGGHEQVPAALGEPSHAPADHGANASRDAQLGVGVGDASLAGEQAHDLRHEERVALGLSMDGRDRPVRGLDPGRELDVLGHITLRQPAECDVRGMRFSQQLSQGRAHRIPERRIDVAISTDHEQPARGDLASDEPK
jgi:hypothetical protein